MSTADLIEELDEAVRFTASDFERVRAMIFRRAGITLADSKRRMVYSRLARRLRETGHADFTAYLDALDRGDSPEWQSFVNALTTNLTSFFREGYHFPILAARLRELAATGRPISIWCAASSTGEEPYSLAMTVAETLGRNTSVRIVASDIDTNVLATARRGVYSEEAAESLGRERLQKFFLRGVRTNAGRIRVRPELAALVSFTQVNLASTSWPFREPFDVIFCRNVMIYFNAQTKAEVMQRMHGALKPEGLLFVGHSENFSDRRELFSLQGKTVYRKVG